MALDPRLMAQLGIKRGSELETPAAASPVDGDDRSEDNDGPSVLPWNAAQAEGTSGQGKREPGERSNRSIERQHRENRIAAGTLRVPQVRRSPARGEDDFEARAFGEELGAGGVEPEDAAADAERLPAGGRRTKGAGRGKRAGSGKGSGSRSGTGARGRGSATATAGATSSQAAPPDAAPVPPAPAPSWADVGAPPAWVTDGELPERVSALLEDWDRREAEAAELIAAGVEVLPAEEQAQREIVELSDEEAEQLARAICLRLLTAMPRTRHELEKKLLEREVPAAAACAVLDRYEELGIIDDAAFAQAWVESRSRSKGFARGRLKQELRRKGVDGEALDNALEQIDGDQERERAEELALRKLGSRTLPPFGYGTPEAAEREKILRRVVGFLARKGYTGGMALSAARSAMERHDKGER
ncbi:regulatory protein RecX [Galactobacter valiniphilus]|nr:regulatory protein RecX [Galactobacter valiniphilus]